MKRKPSNASGARMRTIKTLTGEAIALDNDLLAVVETLFREVTVKKELARTYEDMMREIQNVVAQMDLEELREYLVESLFLNTVTYENEKLGAVLKKLPPADSDPPHVSQ
jgi:phage gp29-like protein